MQPMPSQSERTQTAFVLIAAFIIGILIGLGLFGWVG